MKSDVILLWKTPVHLTLLSPQTYMNQISKDPLNSLKTKWYAFCFYSSISETIKHDGDLLYAMMMG